MGSVSSQFHAAIDSLSSALPELPAAQSVAPLSDPQMLAREMSAAGFREVTIHTVEYTETMPSLPDFWRKIQRAAGGVVLLRHRLGEERWSEVAQDVIERLEELLGNGPVREVYTAYLGVGAK